MNYSDYGKVKPGKHGKLFVMYGATYPHSACRTTVHVITDEEDENLRKKLICVFDGDIWNYSGQWKRDFEDLVAKAVSTEYDAKQAEVRNENLEKQRIEEILRKY